MTRTRRWIAGAAVAGLLLLGGALLAVRSLLPNDDQLAAEIAQRFQKASGIALRVGEAHWSLRPSPVVVLREISTVQERPITVRRIELRPRLAALWRREIAIDTVEIEGAVLPRASVREFRGRWQPEGAGAAVGAAWKLSETPVRRVRLRDIVWFDRRDIALAYDADVRFDPGWRPREAEIQRPGISPPARLRLEREDGQDRWRTFIDVGGGTWNGSTELQATDKGRLRLIASLEPKNIDIAELSRTFDRRNAVNGRLFGQTAIDTEGENLGALVRNLHTRTRFSVKPATLNGFDLAKAVSTAGTSRGGQTRLDELSGTLETQSTDDGIVMRYLGLQARSGLLSASGSATVFNRRLRGDAAVDLVDGVVGVPLKLGGTLDAPELSLTGGALTGAAVGTAVLPGVGTAIGARIGQQVEKLFGGEDKDSAKAPRPPAPSRRP